MDENQVLELVEFYEDMIEKQDEIIVRQSRFIKSLATELSHLRNMLNVEASEDERLDAGIIEEVKEEYVSIKYKIEQRKADEEITHATGRVLFWLHHAIVKGEHNGELEEAFENLQRAEAHKKEMDREVLAKYSID